MFGKSIEQILESNLSKSPTEESLFRRFTYAYNNSSGYRRFLESKGISINRILQHKDFFAIPILRKTDVFPNFRQWIVPGYKSFVFMPSSGTSGVFSFGVFDKKEMAKAPVLIDWILDRYFSVRGKKTLILNLLPMGINVDSQICSTLSVGIRKDCAIEALRNAAQLFHQVIVLGDALFVKSVLEDDAVGEYTRQLDLKLIVGGEFLSEGLRRYFLERLSVNDMFSSFGTAELGLNIMHETPFSRFIRDAMGKIPGLLKAFSIGDDLDFFPMVFQYYPNLYFLESIGNELVITPMGKRPLPLIRYAIGDKCVVFSAKEVENTLKDFGIHHEFSGNRLPFVFFWGRDCQIEVNVNKRVSIARVREALFNNTGLAQVITGRFFVEREGDGIKVHIQTRKDCYIDDGQVAAVIAQFCGVSTQVVHYESDAYPFLDDFERKSKHC